jgi:hypothetical protein
MGELLKYTARSEVQRLVRTTFIDIGIHGVPTPLFTFRDVGNV